MEHQKFVDNVYMGFDEVGEKYCFVAKSAGTMHAESSMYGRDHDYLVFIDPQLNTTHPLYKRDAVVTDGLTHAIIDPLGDRIVIDLRTPTVPKKKPVG